MAKKPPTPQSAREQRLADAERYIDEAIDADARKGTVLVIDTDPLDISEVEWMTVLRPKYIAAGWTVAVWRNDPGGNHTIELDAA